MKIIHSGLEERMATAPPAFLDSSQIQLTIPNAFRPTLSPPPPVPPISSKSSELDVSKILIGLTVVLLLSGILSFLVFSPRTPNGIDLCESNEELAKLLRESNENIARLQREQALRIENERQTRQENFIKKSRIQDRLIEEHHHEQQLAIEDRRLELQQNLTEKHRFEDQQFQYQLHQLNLVFAKEQAQQLLEVEEKHLQILLEQQKLAEQRRNEAIDKDNAGLLSGFMEEVLSAHLPLNVPILELKVHLLIRRFNPLYKSLLIKFLYKVKLLMTENSDNTTLNLQGANLNDINLDDMDIEAGQSKSLFTIGNFI